MHNAQLKTFIDFKKLRFFFNKIQIVFTFIINSDFMAAVECADTARKFLLLKKLKMTDVGNIVLMVIILILIWVAL